MTDTPAQAEHGCTDPHDHSGHDHPPTGADLLRELVQGLSILSLVIPALGVVLLLVILPMAPSTPVVLALGLALGAGHMLSLVATGLFVARTRKQLAVNPGLQAVRSAVEEALRVASIPGSEAVRSAVRASQRAATILLSQLPWPTDLRGELGVWIGAGAALVWLALATAQTAATRRRRCSPSEWAERTVVTMLAE